MLAKFTFDNSDATIFITNILMANAMITGVMVVVTVVMSKALKVNAAMFEEGGFTELFEEGRGD